MKNRLNNRSNPIDLNKEDFRKMGHQLVDSIADFMDTIEENPVTKAESSREIRKIMGTSLLPEKGLDADVLLSKTTDLFLNHSLQNGHPKFMGYITSSAAPIGILADFLAASVNPNVGAQILSPVATEIEKQTVKWLAEFIGISSDCGGILVSGGNMANFTAFLAARTAKLPLETKTEGISNSTEKWTVYCSKTTHTWIEKAVVLFGLGLEAIRWIQADGDNKMVIEELEKAIKEDIEVGRRPFMVVGTAGDVSTGAVDDLNGIAAISEKFDLWFHIDGAYGIPAVVVPELKDKFNGIKEADSIALDPHKWLYAPLEAGCTLVKNPKHLTDTFSSHPEYYNFSNPHDEDTQNYYEYGLQNSRGFRALKVWLILQQVGRNGYIKLFREDIELSKLLFELAEKHPDLEAISNSLSITTLRYKPVHLPKDRNPEEFLNDLNEKLLNKLQFGGEVFLSNAIVKGKYCLRSCIVNFRTTKKDIEEIIQIIVKEGNHIVETQ